MAIKFNNNSQKAVIFNGVDQKRVIFNNKVIWCKPFTLTISKNTGVSSVTVTRTSSEEPSASINSSLSNGATVYYNDELSISASADEFFYLNKYDSNRTVTGDTSINITADLQPKPEAPSILDATTEGSLTSRIATFTLKNNNLFSTTITLLIDDSSGKRLKQEELAFNQEQSRYLVRELPDGDYGIKISACCTNDSGVRSDWSYATATYTQPKVANPTVTNVKSPDGRSCSFTVYNPNTYAIIVVFSVKYDAGYNEFYDEYSGSFELAAKTSTDKSYNYTSSTTHTDRGFLHVQGKMSGYKNSDEVIYNVDVAEETTTRP